MIKFVELVVLHVQIVNLARRLETDQTLRHCAHEEADLLTRQLLRRVVTVEDSRNQRGKGIVETVLEEVVPLAQPPDGRRD